MNAPEITLAAAVKLRSELAARLFAELAGFETLTGCIVASIDLVHEQPVGAPSRLLGVRIDVTLPRPTPQSVAPTR